MKEFTGAIAQWESTPLHIQGPKLDPRHTNKNNNNIIKQKIIINNKHDNREAIGVDMK